MRQRALPAFLLACLAAAAPAQRPVQGRGLWVGPIPACAGTVADVAVAPDHSGELSAILTFRPAWRAALRRETERRLDRPMPVRLDGRMLMAPYVREPIAGGVIALGPVTARQAERIGRAAARPCPRERR
jgi:preprotein translocase subunit SecD